MIIEKTTIRHLLMGAAFFSTGGGGSLREGLDVVRNIDSIELVKAGELEAETWTATAYLAGTVNCPPLEEIARKYPVGVQSGHELVVSALEFLQKMTGIEIGALIPVELGGYNTAVSLYLASQKNLPVLDGDLTGRSAPEIRQTSYFLGGFSPAPAAVTTIFDEKIFLQDITDYRRFDSILRLLVENSYEFDVGVAHFPLKLKGASSWILHNTLSNCIRVGILLENKETMKAIREAKGKILFVGKLEEEQFKIRGGFTVGEIKLKNPDGEIVLKYKNELYVAYLNGTIVSKAPELIGIIGTDGQPVANTQVPHDKDLIVYTLPSPDIWRSEKGAAVFSPEGFEIE
jgi:DUF917 family protein